MKKPQEIIVNVHMPKPEKIEKFEETLSEEFMILIEKLMMSPE